MRVSESVIDLPGSTANGMIVFPTTGIALGLAVVGMAAAFGLAELAQASPYLFALLRHAAVLLAYTVLGFWLALALTRKRFRM